MRETREREDAERQECQQSAGAAASTSKSGEGKGGGGGGKQVVVEEGKQWLSAARKGDLDEMKTLVAGGAIFMLY